MVEKNKITSIDEAEILERTKERLRDSINQMEKLKEYIQNAQELQELEIHFKQI